MFYFFKRVVDAGGFSPSEGLSHSRPINPLSRHISPPQPFGCGSSRLTSSSLARRSARRRATLHSASDSREYLEGVFGWVGGKRLFGWFLGSRVDPQARLRGGGVIFCSWFHGCRCILLTRPLCFLRRPSLEGASVTRTSGEVWRTAFCCASKFRLLWFPSDCLCFF